MGLRVVTDAGPLIHRSEANALDLLAIFEDVVIPETVLAEVNEGTTPEGLDALDYTHRPVEFSSGALPTLDPGETAAILLCEDVGAILLTDDLAARGAASDRGIEVHGSIGVVLFSAARGRIDTGEAETLIRRLERDTSLYLAEPLVDYALRALEEEYPGW